MRKNSVNGLTMSTHLFGGDSASADWISQAEAARIRGVSRQAIARLIKKGRFQILRIGGKVLVKRSEVKSYEPEQPGRPPI
jgi:excisionase family DNA binding protein